jgi:hypothetical protein
MIRLKKTGFIGHLDSIKRSVVLGLAPTLVTHVLIEKSRGNGHGNAASGISLMIVRFPKPYSPGFKMGLTRREPMFNPDIVPLLARVSAQ